MTQIKLFNAEKSGPVLETEPNSIAARAIIDLSKSLVNEYEIKIAGTRAI